ncbi:MAG: alpha/beta hydrolase [Bacteroidales bacterium]
MTTRTCLGTAFVLLAMLACLSCSRQEEAPRIDETIWVRHEGADMPAYVHGNPESNTFLVVLHGAGSYGLYFRKGLFKEILEEKYVVVYFDQRGQSMSQGHNILRDDLLDLMADDVNALIRVLQAKYGRGEAIDFFLMGHSLGGGIGTLALLRNDLQREIRGWISVCGALDFPAISHARPYALMAVAQEQIDLGNSPAAWEEISLAVEDRDPENEEDYREILKQVGKANQLLVADGVVPAVPFSDLAATTLFVNNPVTWLVTGLFNKPVNVAVSSDFSVSGRLQELALPVFLMYGKYDFSVPYLSTLFQGPGVPADLRALLFEKSGHHLYDTEPDLFVEEVVRFMEDIRKSSPRT